jgi:hypothetical protein
VSGSEWRNVGSDYAHISVSPLYKMGTSAMHI